MRSSSVILELHEYERTDCGIVTGEQQAYESA